MLISLILPIHNGVGHMERMLDSIKEQTYKDVQVIVIADKCTDNTADICRSYGFEVYEADFGNAGLSRSLGLDKVKGEWVMFADDDDWWMHEYAFEILSRYIQGNPNFDILCFSFIFKGVGYAHPLGNNGSLWPAVWNKIWRREAIGETRFPNVYPDDDAQFSMLMMQKHPRIAIWDNPLYYYNYMRPGSISDAIAHGEKGEKDA